MPVYESKISALIFPFLSVLTKRAIELVRNKSLLEAQRGLVTTHVFTSFPHLDGGEKYFSALEPAEAPGLHPFTFRRQSDYVAKALEAQLLEKLKNSEKTSYKAKGNIQDIKMPTVASVADSIKLTNVFNKRVNMKSALNIQRDHSVTDFAPSLEKFKSELEAAMRTLASASASPARAWDVDLNLEQENIGLAEVLACEDSKVKVELKETEQSLSQGSQMVSSNDHLNESLEKEIKSFRTELPELDKLHLEWKPGSSPWVMDPEHDTDGVFEDTVNNPFPFQNDDIAIASPDIEHHNGVIVGANQHPSTTSKRGSPKKLTKKREKQLQQVSVQESSEARVKNKRKTVQSLSSHKSKPAEHINVSKELQEQIDKCFVDVSCFTNSVSCFLSHPVLIASRLFHRSSAHSQ